MPRRDGTGPMGMGPMTGWGMGPCGWLAGRRGYGRDTGRRYGNFTEFYPTYPHERNLTKKEEVEILEDEAQYLEEELKDIKARLTKLRTRNK